MIIPDNVIVYMNGRAYYAHVCGFYWEGKRLSLSIDTSCLKDGGAEVNRVEPLNPVRREISINAQINGKSVNISYDPHDPEAVKAAETWRKALFGAGEVKREQDADNLTAKIIDHSSYSPLGKWTPEFYCSHCNCRMSYRYEKKCPSCGRIFA